VRARFLISLVPGVHLRELQRLLGISFSSTRHHVDILSREREIDRVEEGGFSRLYPVGTSDEYRVLFSNIRNKNRRLLLSALAHKQRLTNKQLSSLTGLPKSTVSEQLKPLMESRIVQGALSQKEGIVYSLRDVETMSRLLAMSEDNAVKKATERFIDLWDF
jgi:predicted transcriptional regulator